MVQKVRTSTWWFASLVAASVLVVLGATACDNDVEITRSTTNDDGTTVTTATTASTVSSASSDGFDPAEIGERFGDAVWRVDVDGCGIESGGTAFAVSDRLFVTNQHVIVHDASPLLVSRSGVEIEGTVIGSSVDPDIAVIEVDEPVDLWLEWGAAADIREGDRVVSVGYPAPYSTFSVAEGGVLTFVVEDGERVGIVSDEASDYGSSGGPLFGPDGRVIAVVTEYAPEGGEQTIGVSYTAEHLAATIDEIVSDPTTTEPDCDLLSYGGDPDLDRLWDLCDEGRYWACDSLYERSEPGSDYEDFGATCGDRVETNDLCTTHFGVRNAEAYGSDELLDDLWDTCGSDAAGAAEACDDLFTLAPPGSAYEDFGYTCGDRFDDPDEYCVDLLD